MAVACDDEPMIGHSINVLDDKSCMVQYVFQNDTKTFIVYYVKAMFIFHSDWDVFTKDSSYVSLCIPSLAQMQKMYIKYKVDNLAVL